MPPGIVRVEIGSTVRTLPAAVLSDLVRGASPSSPLGGFYKAQLERDAARERRRLGDRTFARSGRYFVAVRAQHHVCHSLADTLVAALRTLDELFPERTEGVSKYTKISRGYIDRDPTSLYRRAPHHRKYAREFAPGWFVDTHHGHRSAGRFLRDVFQLYGLKPEEGHFSRLQ